MDAVSAAEIIKVIVGAFVGVFFGWLFSRRREKNDLMKMATEAAQSMITELRKDVDELREQRREDQAEMQDIKTTNHKLLCVLKKWTIGLRLWMDDYRTRNLPMPWTPEPEDLEMVENE